MLPYAAMGVVVRAARTVSRVVSHDSPVAPWRQLYALLNGQIASGELAPGSRLPSITDLAQTYGIALTTVRKAMDKLKEDGLIVTSPMGTFVASG
jgi:GntR family transcriptional regulator